MTSAIAVFCGAGLGGLLVGIAIGYFSHRITLPPEARLLIITGFLGGLTTFSTFSGEVVTLITRTEYLLAIVTAGLHLFGSLAMTVLGLMTANAFFIRT